MSIGTAREAATLFWHTRYQASVPPDEWTFVGKGTLRKAFLAPSGVVYKIGPDWANAEEVELIRQVLLLDNTPAGWYVPLAQRFYTKHWGDWSVLAMEFVPGTPDQSGCGGCPVRNQFDCFCDAESDSWQVVKDAWGVHDLHPWNVLVLPDGGKAIIDWSSPSWRE